MSVSISSCRGIRADTIRRSDERGHGVVEIGERGREPPRHEAGSQAAESREGQFRLHAALRREELMPFIHDDGLEAGEDLVGVVEREQDRQ